MGLNTDPNYRHRYNPRSSACSRHRDGTNNTIFEHRWNQFSTCKRGEHPEPYRRYQCKLDAYFQSRFQEIRVFYTDRRGVDECEDYT